ncbi:MAG TPA: protein kinase [Thermoanaerobaculia bacterium]|nr:protein kinase [Thermoanaerobaculia bacterium]
MNVREPGTVLDGKYEIVQRLASGGMGEVYQVRHLHLHELRVVKILRQDLAADSSAQKRFMREARLATQIKHPNVAILYDFSTLPDGSFYMVWEHIEGRDIGDRIRQQGPFPLPMAIQLGIQALRGLEAVHHAGIVHRDVSPDNLMITHDRRGQPLLKIIDLGLAKTLEDSTANRDFEITQVGMFMGKLRYCSPEQARAVDGEALDLRTDIYSFGQVLYEMICALPPFDSESQHGFIFKRLSEDPLPLTGRNTNVQVPKELDRVVLKALERERDNRYPDAAVFIQELDAVARGLSAAETQEIPIPPMVRPAAPKPRSSSELSRDERAELLAQIERAGRRTQESAPDVSRAEAALAAGRLDEARDLIGKMEVSHPRAVGTARLKERLSQALEAQAAARAAEQAAQAAAQAAQAAQAAADRERRTAEAEQVLDGYLQKKQLPLARMALETLLELQPGHPRRAELEERVEALARELAPPPPAPVPAPAPVQSPQPPQEAQRVAENQEAPSPERRVAEAEQVLTNYLQKKQLPLARLALETLLELQPKHPRRSELQGRVDALAQELERQKRLTTAQTAGREAIARRDFKAARRELDALVRSDPTGERAAAFHLEMEAAEKEARQESELEEGRRLFEAALGAGKLEEAQRQLDQLASLDLPRVTLDFYRERLDEVRTRTQQEGQIAVFDRRYKAAVKAHDWLAAREVARELAASLPGTPRAAAMFGEVERLEAEHRRQQSIEQGVKQVEAFLGQKDLPKAELAFKILLQMDPENHHRKRFEREIRALQAAK